jgi:hypothetical protein
VRGIRADLVVEIEVLDAQFSDEAAPLLRNEFIGRLRDTRESKDAKDMPQGWSAPTSFVFELVKADLTVLPAELIEPTVRFDRLDQRLGALIDHFASGQYEGLADSRQIEAVDAYFALGKRTRDAAISALKACDIYLTPGTPRG